MYRDYNGATECVPCGPGQFSAEGGQCQACPIGQVSTSSLRALPT